MPVTIDAIQFNHDPNSITNDAINIRKNISSPVLFPEWQNGICTVPEDSLAAYCIKETQGNTITIKASFTLSHISSSMISIRAIDPNKNPPGGSGCMGVIAKLLFQFFNAIAGNVLGEVEKKDITTVSGSTGFISFNLINSTIGKSGIGIHTTTWLWQYSIDGRKTWTDITTTQHRIYILLETPKTPWDLTPGSQQNPWTDVLNYSCSWAALANNADDAASGITSNVFNLGPSTLIYDCPNGGSTHYTGGSSFFCTQFIDRLKGGLGNGQYVNCTDCGTIVSSFSNILGCDLWSSRMGGLHFDLNAINAIGYNNWISCGWSGFSYHEVAWKNNCTEADAVFDGCLQVDGDADPTTAPHTPLLPANINFGTCTSNEYRWRLSPPGASGCDACSPQPGTRIRRTIA
jgi:hypothetical protein